MKSRILLTGGTGFIGGALARALQERGDEVAVVSRRGPLTWDDVEREVARADAVVHLAGEPIADGRWTAERFERIGSSRVETTARLARAIADAPASSRPRVLVSGSAVGIYGMRRDDAVCDEDTPPGDDVLARLCVAWEDAARPASTAGVRVVHPRVGIVLGKGGALAKMSGAFRWFVGGPVGSGAQWVSWVHVRDAVRALMLLVDRGDLSGPFDVTAPA
ncbi:MAG: TIGR01777 family oxidoreductase, partial [Polyangiaceae bacterium]